MRVLVAAVQCGGAPVHWGLRPGLLVTDFGWCNFCVLDLKKKKKIVQDLKLVLPSISSSHLRLQKKGGSELKNSMV